MKKILFICLTVLLSFSFSFGAACAPDNPGAFAPGNETSETGEAGETEKTSESDDHAALWDVSDTDVSHIGKNHRLIAFTFDDGPTEKTDALLDVFEEFNAKNPDFTAHATLFTIGSALTAQNADVLKRAVKMNFELGNHTYTHTNLTTLTDEKIIEELRLTDEKLKNIDGKSVHPVRPAGGHADGRVLSLYQTIFINWTVTLGAQDYEPSTTENGVYNMVMTNVLDGGIVLMHQGYDKTVAAVKRLLPDLKAIGFQVVSVSELIKYYDVKAETGKLYDSFI